MADRRDDKSLPTLLQELWQLVISYAKQETLDPVKRLGRFVAFGAAGMLVMGIGLVLLFLGGLRALQTETTPHLTGHLSWIPYFVALVASGAVAGGAMAARSRGQRKKSSDRAARP